MNKPTEEHILMAREILCSFEDAEKQVPENKIFDLKVKIIARALADIVDR